jgi:hypothetical protein
MTVGSPCAGSGGLASGSGGAIIVLLSSGHRWCYGSSAVFFYMYVHGVRALAMGVPAMGLRVHGRPPPVPPIREGRAPSWQFDDVDHACAHGGGDSIVATLGHRLWRPEEATMPFVALSTEHLRGFWVKAQLSPRLRQRREGCYRAELPS